MKSLSVNLFFLALCICLLSGCEDNNALVKKANIGDAEIAYYTRGSGEPLIMIMGFRGTMTGWDPALLNMLEKNYTLIIFDNRGIGLSSNDSKNTLTIPQMSDDTAKLIKALGYSKAHVLGWSMGSRIAIDLAIRHPEVVETMVLCSPTPGGKHKTVRKSEAYKVLTSKDISQKEALSLIFPDTVKGNMASAGFVIRLTEALLRGKVPNDLNITQEIINQQIHALQLWDEDNEIYENLPNIKTPTLVTGGLEDMLNPSENVQIVACRIPLAWTAFFSGSGHAFLSQDHEQFGELVHLFIESNKD